MTHLRLLIIAMLTFTVSTAIHAEPLGTAFTYQGELVQSGTAVTGTCDFNFGCGTHKPRAVRWPPQSTR